MPRAGRAGGAHEVEQMRALDIVELQRPGYRLKHVFRDAAGVPAFELGVVVDADPGEHSDFLAAQTRHAPVPAVGDQAGLLRGDPGPAGGGGTG
jgi:hypothetical protein